MLGTPSIPRYCVANSGEVTTRRVRAISRKGRKDVSSGILRGHTPGICDEQMMIWSELHGDVENWAEPETTQSPP